MPKETKPRQITVGIGLVVAEEKVLFVKRYSPEIPEYDGKWELPGGKIEPGEAIEDAIEREVLEETGVTIHCSRLLPFSYARTLHTSGNTFHIVVLCADCTLTEPVPSSPANSSRTFPLAPTWIPVSQIPYERVIPGSKEFVLWRLHTLNAQNVPPKANFYEMNLQAVDTLQNKSDTTELLCPLPLTLPPLTR